jgi:D-3-phosphoglycerate dehydrogenase
VIDTAICNARSIRYFNSPDGNAQSVAEHALGLLLSLLRNIPKASNEVKKGAWIREPNRGEELSGKTIAIIGFGHTGSAFAKVLSGFAVNILAYDKYKKHFSTDTINESTLEAIFEQADVLSIHLPLTLETTHFVDASFLSKFKKPIHLINTSRGKVLNTADLIKEFETGRVLNIGLDVLENEKFDTYSSDEASCLTQLKIHQNVVITPHIAGWTHQSKVKIAMSLLRQLANFL